MANNKSETLAHNVINYFLRANVGTISSTATVYAALFTEAPTKTGFGVEVTGGSYARVDCGEGSGAGPKFSAPTAGVTSNNAAITFPTATAGWGNVVAVAILNHQSDAATANVLYFGNLTAAKTVDSGDTVTFTTGSLEVTET